MLISKCKYFPIQFPEFRKCPDHFQDILRAVRCDEGQPGLQLVLQPGGSAFQGIPFLTISILKGFPEDVKGNQYVFLQQVKFQPGAAGLPEVVEVDFWVLVEFPGAFLDQDNGKDSDRKSVV